MVLSMIIEIFCTSREDMPGTKAELYTTACNVMLERTYRLHRGSVAAAAEVPHLDALLQAIMFDAHATQRRIIDEEQLLAGALGLVNPKRLAEIEQWHASKGRPKKGQYVKIVGGEYAGKFAVVLDGVKKGTSGRGEPTYSFKMDGGEQASGVLAQDFINTGLSKADFISQYGDAARKSKLASACEHLPVEINEALNALRELVLQGRLPLLSLIQAEPLQIQASHLSFQEFYAARAMCVGARLAGPAPWQWPAWWGNTLTVGSEMESEFRAGLRRAAEVNHETLDLKEKIGGHRPTSLAAVGQLIMETQTVDISQNRISADDAIILAGAIRDGSMTTLDMSGNAVGEIGGRAIADALEANSALTKLDLSHNNLGSEAGRAFATNLETNKVLRHLALAHNSIQGIGAQQLAAVVFSSTTLDTFSYVPIRELREGNLTDLDLHECGIGPTECIVLAKLIKRSDSTLRTLILDGNHITDEGAIAMSDSLKTNTVLHKLAMSNNPIRAKGVTALAECLKSNHTLEDLVLKLGPSYQIDAKVAAAICSGVQHNKGLKNLHLRGVDKTAERTLRSELEPRVRGGFKLVL
jgi:Leucine-rich repeat (LRR) protein